MQKPQEYATKLAKLPERAAAILAKSVGWQGDDWELDDAEVIGRLVDLIVDLDPTLMERMAKANKKLVPRRRH